MKTLVCCRFLKLTSCCSSTKLRQEIFHKYFSNILHVFSVTDEAPKNRSEKRSSTDRFHANLVKWQGAPLQTPLLKLPVELNELALECFECILRYCGDLPQDHNFSEVKCVYTVLMVWNLKTFKIM